MSLAPRLDLRQSQSLVMTPQLQQAIKLLALSNLEVEAFIAEELEKNPLLDAQGGGEDTPDPVPPEDQGEWESLRDSPADASELLNSGAEALGEAALDVDLSAEAFHHDSAVDSLGGMDGGLGLNGAAGSMAEDGPDFDNMAAGGASLADHLMAQAGASIAGDDLFIAAQIIDQIDECGYLQGSLLDLSSRLEVPLARSEQVLAIIQTFDPTGVGARSLSECLALQAKEADRYDPCMARLIDNLDLVARGDMARLKRICGVDDEDLADMVRELRSYDPKPGCRFGGEPPASVIPDVFVARRRDGWAVELNGATLPRLLVNRSYHAQVSAGPQDKASKAWLSDCLASANWLIKTLDQRQRTIVKVAGEIVKQQEAFFLRGVAHLRPLTLRQVAEAIEMHESTVSRVTSNKYLSCARGLFELKYFFTSAIAAADGGEAVSAEAVKSAIRALIAAEDAKKILSDDTLVELLNAKGFDIARRTVAKYREAMGIGSSVQRRRQKALAGAT
ncbi:RNA polymerase factor sigma-54 [Sphingomonas xinjiangensis]|uniref:RNA polymerase sigma-54 factor n=1 Tax=Sphingomonas xinjiangensis TaxID=643568 RepID=A0A840YLX2_9SPHN|nr:RNA polymerase factor sigma-54 [Sphingomonas xinjiangensis]MBB5710380.1 RNA polymerase sigma-54 factor [Sphingomonas xinjiangensis]